MSLQLTDIWRYPVKSCRGERLTEAVVEPWGLAGDRRWMIVDDAGDPVTARESRTCSSSRRGWTDGDRSPWPPGRARADGPGAVRHRPASRSTCGDTTCSPARPATRRPTGSTSIVGEPVRLVYLDDPTRRATDPDYSRARRPGVVRRRVPAAADHRGVPGGAERLDRRGPGSAEGPVPMRRFRPSVVVVRRRRRGRRTAGAGCASARSPSGSPRAATAACSPRSTPTRRQRATSRSSPWPGTAAGTARSGSASTSSPTPLPRRAHPPGDPVEILE